MGLRMGIKLLCIFFVFLFACGLSPGAPVFGETPVSGAGVIIGRVEARLENADGSYSTQLGGIEVDIVREETVRGEVLEETIEISTSDTGLLMAPLDTMEGNFRIARLRLPESEEWLDITKLSVEGDVIRYGARYFRRYGSVVAVNSLIYEESYDGQGKFIMVVGPFADMCLVFLGAFPASPWEDAIEQARSMSLRAEGSVEERAEPEKEEEEEEVEAKRKDETLVVGRPVKALLSEEEPPPGGSGASIIILAAIVLVILAIMVGVGGRRRYRPGEREIDIREIELIKAEREKQQIEEHEEGEKAEADPTAILYEKEGWFLREFRRARVRIHWKKYDSAAVSLEKTTKFMEDQIDRLGAKKEIYTLVLHYSYLGRCYLESERYNDALRAFKRGVEFNEYNSRMCEMGLADTLDAIARFENSPSTETLTVKYPLLSAADLESILATDREADS